MDRHQAEVRRSVAEARLERAERRIKYLRDGALYGYQDDAAYRTAVAEYHAAYRELLAARYGDSVARSARAA
jgi:hypothetical protein